MPYLHLPCSPARTRPESHEPPAWREDYCALVGIRAARRILLSGDFIVGFRAKPRGFSCDLESCAVATLGVSFKYSPRPGTPGAEMADHVPEAVKDERLQRLQALLVKQQQDFGTSLVGSTIDTLIEKPGRQAGQKVGRSPWLQPVIVDEKAGKIGDIIRVRITKTGYNSLFAELAS
jgi:tRNA-2-methylthio-N6-dimethylallyladenosine synthase